MPEEDFLNETDDQENPNFDTDEEQFLDESPVHDDDPDDFDSEDDDDLFKDEDI